MQRWKSGCTAKVRSNHRRCAQTACPPLRDRTQETQRRWHALADLGNFMREALFAYYVQCKGFAEPIARKFGGVLLPFGSFKIGIATQGSDMDTVLVANKCAGRGVVCRARACSAQGLRPR